MSTLKNTNNEQNIYSFMYKLRLLNKHYTNHIYINSDDTINTQVQNILNIFKKYKVYKTIIINYAKMKVIVWKTCDFADQDRIGTINCETNLLKELKELNYEVEHNYRTFMIRNFNACITTYHNLDNIFEYGATIILLTSKVLNNNGIIFMNENYINTYYGYAQKEKEFIDMLQNNYQYITLVDNIQVYFCFKNKKLIKKYIIIDNFITDNNIDIIIQFIKNKQTRTKEKYYCMYDITYFISTYTNNEIINIIGEEKFNNLMYLCDYKIDEKHSHNATYYIK